MSEENINENSLRSKIGNSYTKKAQNKMLDDRHDTLEIMKKWDKEELKKLRGINRVSSKDKAKKTRGIRLRKEEAEQLSELSTKTLKSYLQKSGKSRYETNKKLYSPPYEDYSKMSPEEKEKTKKTSWKRLKGKVGAEMRLDGKFIHKRNASSDATRQSRYHAEEAEPLQELSKKTLMSYMQKSENEYYKTNDKKKKTKRLQGVVRAGLAHRKKKDMNESNYGKFIPGETYGDNPSADVRKHYAQSYIKHVKSGKKPKEAEDWAYGAVHKKYGNENLQKLKAYHKKNMNEDFTPDEYHKAAKSHPNYSHTTIGTNGTIYHHFKNKKISFLGKTGGNIRVANVQQDKHNGKHLVHRSLASMKKHLNEETEQLQELSKRLLKSYIKKAGKSANKSTHDFHITDNKEKKSQLSKTFHKRVKGLDRAKWRAEHGQYFPKGKNMFAKYHTEEAEQLQELSKKTLGSYIKKASHSASGYSAATGRYAERSRNTDKEVKQGNYDNYAQGRKDNEFADKMFKKSWKRRMGIEKATDKLTKEETENLQELSKKTLGRYIKGAVADVEYHAKEYGTLNDFTRGRKHFKTATKRMRGIHKATDKLTKEETLNEISDKKLAQYKKKADKSVSSLSKAAGKARSKFRAKIGANIASDALQTIAGRRISSSSGPEARALADKAEKRQKYASKASSWNSEKSKESRQSNRDYRDKMNIRRNIKVINKLAKEEVEQIDELSKKLLGRYINKASFQASKLSASLRGKDGIKNYNKTLKRRAGIGKAVEKLAKEEVENLQELSKGILNSYLEKSERSWEKAGKRDSSGNPRPGYRKVRDKRETGMATAMKKLAKESVSHIVESINNKEKKE